MDGIFQQIRLDRKERWVAGFSSLGLIFFLFLIYDDSILDHFFPREESDNNQPMVATVVQVQNEIHYKNSSSLQWKKTEKNQLLHLGDSIFNGPKSFAEIELTRGGSVMLGENSLIFFSELEGISIPNLAGGNFNLKVDGKLRVNIGGEITEFVGKKSEIKVVIKKYEKPKIILLQGEAKIKTNLIPQQPLKINTVVKVETPQESAPEEIFKPLEVPAPTEFKLKSMSAYNYYFKLNDLYSKKTNFMYQRLEESPLDLVPMSIELSWIAQHPQSKSIVQIAKDEDFKAIIAEFKTEETSLLTNKIYLGKNFWRVTSNQITWSKPVSFVVQHNLVPLQPPRLSLLETKPKLIGGKAYVALQFSSAAYFQSHLLEVSENPDFTAAETSAYLISSARNTWTLTSTAKTYFRVRGITQNMELTEFSKTDSAQAEIPVIIAKPKPPVIKIDETKVAELKKISEEVAQKVERAPAEIEESKVTAQVDLPISLNKDYLKSKITLMSAAFSIFSATQVSQNSQSPMVLLGGVEVQHWFNRSGLDILLKAKVAGLNKSASETSPLLADIKYKYKMFTASSFFSTRKEMSWQAIVGYESYKNSGSTVFSAGYTLYKAGFGLAMPLFKNIDTGGEVLYGINPSSSKKTEISGYMGYYLKKNLAIDAGYRLNMFEAGNPNDAPTNSSLPYRETYGEGYSGFRWNY